MFNNKIKELDVELIKKIHDVEKDRQCKVVEVSEETKQFLDACFKYLQELSKIGGYYYDESFLFDFYD